MPPHKAIEVYRAHKAFYDGLQRAIMKATKSAANRSRCCAGPRRGERAAEQCVGTHESGGHSHLGLPGQSDVDGRQSQRGVPEQLLAVWDSGKFKGNYATLHAKIKAALPPTQSPRICLRWALPGRSLPNSRSRHETAKDGRHARASSERHRPSPGRHPATGLTNTTSPAPGAC